MAPTTSSSNPSVNTSKKDINNGYKPQAYSKSKSTPKSSTPSSKNLPPSNKRKRSSLKILTLLLKKF